jgi:hypothetical protein
VATRPTWNPQAPKPGTSGYDRVVARGCGLVHYPMEGDYDCSHRYGWSCDECPWSLDARKETDNEGSK